MSENACTRPEGSTRCCVTATDDIDTTSYAYACKADDAPCLVLEAIARPLHAHIAVTESNVEVRRKAEDQAIATARSLLPCTICQRQAQADVARLRGLRLGKHERRILLEAAPPDREHGQRIDPPAPTSVADEAHRRAIRRLAQTGLVHVGRDTHKVKIAARTWWGKNASRHYWHRVTWRSPLGESIVAAYQTQLVDGVPIRWATSLSRLMSSGSADARVVLGAFDKRLYTRAQYHEAILMMVKLHGHGQKVADTTAMHMHAAIEVTHLRAAVTTALESMKTGDGPG